MESLQETPKAIRMLFRENLASSLPHNNIQKYVDQNQRAVIYVIKDFMACIKSAIQVTSSDDTPMTIMIPLAAVTVNMYISNKNIHLLEFDIDLRVFKGKYGPCRK